MTMLLKSLGLYVTDENALQKRRRKIGLPKTARAIEGSHQKWNSGDWLEGPTPSQRSPFASTPAEKRTARSPSSPDLYPGCQICMQDFLLASSSELQRRLHYRETSPQWMLGYLFLLLSWTTRRNEEPNEWTRGNFLHLSPGSLPCNSS